MNIGLSRTRHRFRCLCVIGALALAAASACAATPEEEIAARREENAPVLYLGPDVRNGSFEDGLAGWRKLSAGLGVVRTVQDGVLDQAADGKAYLHYQVDIILEDQREGNPSFDCRIPVAGVSKKHALKLTWQQRGPCADRKPFARIRYAVKMCNKAGKQVGGKSDYAPAATDGNWQPVTVDLGVPPPDCHAIDILLTCEMQTTALTGLHEASFDDFRLQRVPIDPWQCDLAYFPSYNKLQVKANSYYRKPRAIVTLRDAKKNAVWRQEASLQDGTLDALYDVPELAGTYTLHIDSADDEHRWTHEITRRKYAWEGNTLGITEKVLPPFTPMIVTGRTVGVVLRDYTLDGLGLPFQVTSEKHPLLAAPIRLLADGQPLADARGAFVDKTDGRVAYRGEALRGEVMFRNATTIEYDGCAKFELTLEPRRETATIGTLVLEIPLQDEASTLWHVCREFLRVNIAGELPKGNGPIWSNRDFNRKSYYGGETAFRGYFLPYIWIGNEERGLSWFADNDKNWGTDPKAEKPYLTLHRDGGVLTLRIHLVQAPTVLDRPRTLVFGLMASPAKPMPENWREWISGRADFGWVGSQYFGTRATFNGKYPEGRDFGLVDLQRQVRRARLYNDPMPDVGAGIAAWAARATPEGFHPDAKQRLLNLARAFINHGMDRPAYTSSYFEEHNTLVSHEECLTFGWEWTAELYPWWSGYLRQFAGKLPPDPAHYSHGTPYGAAPSYHDFAVWYAAEFIKRGAGTYLDNTFPRSIRNTVTTDAYRVSPDVIQPSAAIWAQREYHKRLWVLHQTATPADTPGIMMIHMTNAKVLPLLSFNQIDLDLEWRDECAPFQAKYAPDLLRTETIGRHTGNIPTALANTHGSEKDGNLDAMCRRTRDAGLLVHEARHAQVVRRYEPFERTLRDFGYDQTDTRIYNYWAKEAPVTPSDDRVKWLLCRRNGRLLLLLCSWIPERRGEPYERTLDDEFSEAMDTKTAMGDGREPKLPPPPGRTLYDTLTVRLDLAQLECSPASVKDAEYPDGKTVCTPPGMHPQHVPGWVKLHYPPGPFEFTYQGAVAWNKEAGVLTVPLRGYGVRMLILE